jgi:hypothetical protein
MKSQFLALVFFLPVIAWAQQRAIDLSGQWQFQFDPDDTGIEEEWYLQELEDTITLPATTTTAGKGEPTSAELNLKAPTLKRLLQEHQYVGAAWYSRTIELPNDWDRAGSAISFERVLWESRLWINGHPVGREYSLSTPHRYEVRSFLTPGENRIAVRIDNRELLPIGIGHAYTEETQTLWNGILGDILLQEGATLSLESLRVTPRHASGEVVVEVAIINRGTPATGQKLRLQALPKNFSGQKQPSMEFTLPLPQGRSAHTLVYKMGDSFASWSEFSPRLYELEATFPPDSEESVASATTVFGMRSIRTEGKHILLNGERIFFRGNLECAIFPETGHPDVEGRQWEKIMRKTRQWGLNHLRFHSWTPPKAAFEAADRHGIYLQVELPNWSFHNGERPQVDEFFLREGERILREFGNHPSLVLMSLGNEITGDFPYLDSVVDHLRSLHPSILYTSTTYSFSPRGKEPGPLDDFFISQETSGGWVRGQGFLNSTPPNTTSDYAEGLSTVPVPLITHEVGQYVVYPDLSDLAQYEDSPMRNIAYESVAADLEAKGRLHEADDYTMASGQLAALLYKEDMERALRTKNLAGIQLLQLQDFPGQGTATVGLLDPFWENKGIIDAKDFRNFSSPTVPLLRMPKRIYDEDETLAATVEAAHFGEGPLPAGKVLWEARHGNMVVASGAFGHGRLSLGNGHTLGEIQMPLAGLPAPCVLEIAVAIPEARANNSWKVWVYPNSTTQSAPAGVEVTRTVSDEVLAGLRDGASVLFLAPENTIQRPIHGRFIPVFWSPVHFSNQPGTLGALIDPDHPVYDSFPTGLHTDWQWWDLLRDSVAVDVQHLEADFSMPFRFVDKFNRNALPAALFEARVGQGKLFVCTLDITTNLDERPAAARLRSSLMEYLGSGRFDPKGDLTEAELRSLFGKPRLTAAANSQHPDYPANYAVDGDKETIWHTDWNHEHGPPFVLTVELPEEHRILGYRYVPRQDNENGRVKEYHLEVGKADGEWIQVTDRQSFPAGTEIVEFRFDETPVGKYLRMHTYNSQDGRPMASVAEFLPLLEADAAETLDVRDLGIIPGFNDDI